MSEEKPIAPVSRDAATADTGQDAAARFDGKGRGERGRDRRRGRDRPEPRGERREQGHRGDERRQRSGLERPEPQIHYGRALNVPGGGSRRDRWASAIEKLRSIDGVMAPLGVRPPKEIERDPIWTDSVQGLPKAVELMGQVPADGLQSLRDGVARFLTREGVATTEHEVFITRGVQHSLALLTLCFVDPGTTVITEKLTRARAIQAFKQANARIEVAPSDSDGVDPRALDRRLQAGGVRFVYLNPTYREPDDAILFDKRRQEIAEVCARRGVVLVEDDSFRQVYFGAPPPRPIPPPSGLFRVHLLDLEMLVSPSLPVAAMALPLPVKERLMRFVDANGIRTERIPQEIASRLLNHNGWNVYLDRLRVILRKRREAWLQGVEGWLKEHIEYHAPRGGHYLWLKLKNGRPTHQLAEVALDHKVAIWPGEIFDPEFHESPHFAVSILDLAPEEVPEAVNRLKAAIEKLVTLPVPRPRPKTQEPRPPKPQQPKPQPKAVPGPQQAAPAHPGGQQGGRRKRRHRRERVPDAPWIDEPTDDTPPNLPKPGEPAAGATAIRVEPTVSAIPGQNDNPHGEPQGES